MREQLSFSYKGSREKVNFTFGFFLFLLRSNRESLKAGLQMQKLALVGPGFLCILGSLAPKLSLELPAVQVQPKSVCVTVNKQNCCCSSCRVSPQFGPLRDIHSQGTQAAALTMWLHK